MIRLLRQLFWRPRVDDWWWPFAEDEDGVAGHHGWDQARELGRERAAEWRAGR